MAGAVNVLYGSAAGLTSDGNQFWSQDSPGILDQSELGDEMGWSVTGADYDGDGFADMATGDREERVGTVYSAGATSVIYGGPTGLTDVGNQFWNQDSDGILDQCEQSDVFGMAIG